MADYPPLGPFLPFLVLRRLRAVLWPDELGSRAAVLLLFGMLLAYGALLGFLLNHQEQLGIAVAMPHLVRGLYTGLLGGMLLMDFLPAVRFVRRPLPDHFPVSARKNIVTAFLLDFISLRRLGFLAGLLTALLVAPSHGSVSGVGIGLVLTAAVLSFNVRLLMALRWAGRLLFFALHGISLVLLGWWIYHPASYFPLLGPGIALLPWALGCLQLYRAGPYFRSRYLVWSTAPASDSVFNRLSPEWKVYFSKGWLPLLTGLTLKVLMLVLTSRYLATEEASEKVPYMFVIYLPVLSFTYVNNNLFGFLGALASNEVQRLGLTSRLPVLYLHLVGPVVLGECAVSAFLLLVLFPASLWPLLGLLPLSAGAFLSLGWWGSCYAAKLVQQKIDFGNMRQTTSLAVTLATMTVAGALYFLPSWGARFGLAGAIILSAFFPLREVLSNRWALRSRLWRILGP